MLHFRSIPLRAPGPGRAGAFAAVALHAAVAAVLLSYEPARSALLSAAPIMVELITPPVPAPRIEPPAKPAVEPPIPRPVTKALPRAQPTPPQPILTAPATAPSPVAEPPRPPALASPSTAASADQAPAAGSSDGAPAGAKASTRLTEPIFNADYLENPAPAYPALSRRSGEEGKVMLRVLVSPAGRADDVQVRTSSGSPRLDEAARTTVLRWKFVPAKRGDEAVSAWVLIPISFRLEG